MVLLRFETAVLATLVVYGLFTVHPPAHEPLTGFLATFKQHNAAVWSVQIVWYGCALSIVTLALWPIHRSTQLICLLAAALFAWEGIAYFAVLSSSMSLSGFWAAVFVLEAVLLVVAGVMRHDLVIHPCWDLASVLGGVFIGFALLGYPIVGMLGGHLLSTLPLFGLAPYTAVTNASPERQQTECHSHVLAGAPAQGGALRLTQTGSLAPSLPHPELGRRLYERTLLPDSRRVMSRDICDTSQEECEWSERHLNYPSL